MPRSHFRHHPLLHFPSSRLSFTTFPLHLQQHRIIPDCAPFRIDGGLIGHRFSIDRTLGECRSRSVHCLQAHCKRAAYAKPAWTVSGDNDDSPFNKWSCRYRTMEACGRRPPRQEVEVTQNPAACMRNVDCVAVRGTKSPRCIPRQTCSKRVTSSPFLEHLR